MQGQALPRAAQYQYGMCFGLRVCVILLDLQQGSGPVKRDAVALLGNQLAVCIGRLQHLGHYTDNGLH